MSEIKRHIKYIRTQGNNKELSAKHMGIEYTQVMNNDANKVDESYLSQIDEIVMS